jgi:hypothetical protein
MTLANKALWVIERNLYDALTLIAEACGVPRYHPVHALPPTSRR